MITMLQVAAIVTGVAVLVGACLTRKPVRALLQGALQGVCALAAVNVVSVFSGVTLGVTPFSLAVSAALGIPGTAALLVLQAVIGL